MAEGLVILFWHYLITNARLYIFGTAPFSATLVGKLKKIRIVQSLSFAAICCYGRCAAPPAVRIAGWS